MFDHWRKAAKTDSNIGSNGDGSSLEVPRTTDLWESRPVPPSIGLWNPLLQEINTTNLLTGNLTQNNSMQTEMT